MLQRLSSALIKLYSNYTLKDYHEDIITPEMFPGNDDAKLQAAVAYAEGKSLPALGIYTPVAITLNRKYTITKELIVNGGRVRFLSEGAGCIVVSNTGVYADGCAIHITGGDNLASYTAAAKPIFDGVTFLSEGRLVDLFLAYTSGANSNNNGACLHSVSNCSFRGFRRIFTNGDGGWGWSWVNCQFSFNQTLGYIRHKTDTYERFSYTNCIWQGGGVAFDMDNSDGRIYWTAGSFDFCDGIADIQAGFIHLQGHIESIGRTRSYIKLLGPTASATLTCDIAIRQNTATQWYLCEQYQDHQLCLRDFDLTTDGVNVSSGLISNKAFTKSHVYLPSDAAKLIGYFSCDEELLLSGSGFFTTELTRSDIMSVSIASGVLTFKGLFGAGTTSFMYLDIPITGKNQLSFKMVCSNTSDSSVNFTKHLLNANKQIVSDLTQGNSSIAAGAANTTVGLRTVVNIPQTASYLRLSFNGFPLSSTKELQIKSLKVWLSD